MRICSTSERLKQIMNERDLKQVDILEACRPFCEQYNIRLGKNDLSQYISGKVVPKQDKLSILGLALSVDEVWLMGYDVPHERASSSDPQDAKAAHLYHQLDDTDKGRVIERMETMLEADKYQEKEGSLAG